MRMRLRRRRTGREEPRRRPSTPFREAVGGGGVGDKCRR
jgi:hypothetical protein